MHYRGGSLLLQSRDKPWNQHKPFCAFYNPYPRLWNDGGCPKAAPSAWKNPRSGKDAAEIEAALHDDLLDRIFKVV